ncbi:hypothetical protein MNBD_NITROSPINAE02-2074 [hydrothermal vent metagenome]|uniref:C1q domain-containing protein n=1 Tax=hydrothermal vent metagenome TaxID=652676 RepID=A0A3B1CPV1_9ZZZZ
MPIQGYTPNKNLTKISQGSTDNWDVLANANLDILDEPALKYQIAAQENLSAGDVAAVRDDGFGAKKAYKATSATYTFGEPLGMVTENVSQGSSLSLTLVGKALNSGWTFGGADKYCYLSASGTVTTTQTGLRIGYVLSSTSIYFDPQLIEGDSPAFSAHRNGTDQAAIPAATPTKILFTAKEYDTLNNFDASASRFQPKVAGRYQLTACVTWKTFSDGARGTASIYLNGSEYKSVVTRSPATGAISSVITITLFLNGSTDYVELYAEHDTGASKDMDGASSASWLMGALIG